MRRLLLAFAAIVLALWAVVGGATAASAAGETIRGVIKTGTEGIPVCR